MSLSASVATTGLPRAMPAPLFSTTVRIRVPAANAGAAFGITGRPRMRNRTANSAVGSPVSPSTLWAMLQPAALHGSSSSKLVAATSRPVVLGMRTKYSVSPSSRVPAGAAKRFRPATTLAGRINSATRSPFPSMSLTAWIEGVNAVALVCRSTEVTRYSSAADPVRNRCRRWRALPARSLRVRWPSLPTSTSPGASPTNVSPTWPVVARSRAHRASSRQPLATNAPASA